MPQICDMGQTALLNFRKKACWGFFRSEKSDGFGRVWTRELGYQRPAHYLWTTETLGWPYTEGTWLYMYCDYFMWFAFSAVVVLTGFVMCGCFGNKCTCIYCVLYCFVYVHSVNMLYQLVVILVELYQNWLCVWSSFKISWPLLWSNIVFFAVFLTLFVCQPSIRCVA